MAIASAVTAYAIIHMIPFKLLPGTVYTDTDSIFTTDKLPDHLLGKELGLMKDELNGTLINEGYFLGIKKYGYQYAENNVLIDKSVFAGVTRDSLTFEEVKEIYNGKIINKDIPVRFYKTFDNLSINIKSSHITIKFEPDKVLMNNEYLPKNINLTNKFSIHKLITPYLKSLLRILELLIKNSKKI